MHNHPIMASSSSAFDLECGACASSNKGGKYCTTCVSPRLKHQAVLAALVVDVATPTAVVAAPVAMAKAIPYVPMPGAVIGAPALVVKKAKVPKESTPATLDKSTVQ
jgi:hypothetical protein